MTPFDKTTQAKAAMPRLWVQLLSAPFSKTPEAIHVRVATQCKTKAMPGDWEYMAVAEHEATVARLTSERDELRARVMAHDALLTKHEEVVLQLAALEAALDRAEIGLHHYCSEVMRIGSTITPKHADEALAEIKKLREPQKGEG